MMLRILFEDKYIIAIEKPPGIPVQSDKTNDPDLMADVKSYLLQKKPDNNDPYVGLLHRLDRPVGGVIVFAKNKFANSKISEAIRLREFTKEYLTVVCGKPNELAKKMVDYLIKLRTINMSKVVEEGKNGAKKAVLSYEVVDTKVTSEFGELTLLRVNLETGRHHQIRVQLSNAGIPIWGDNKYNKSFVKMKEWTQIALWSHKVSFSHPKTGQSIMLISHPDSYPYELFINNS